MKNFDLVKFTLLFAGVLVAVMGGGYLWLGKQLTGATRDLAVVKRSLREIGELSGDLDLLEKERENDKAVNKETATYLLEQARYAGINGNRDYSLNFRDGDERSGYKDTYCVLNFKPGGAKSRDALFKFVYNVETQSPRIKLVKARLQLDPKVAKQDEWKTELQFLRRDPLQATP